MTNACGSINPEAWVQSLIRAADCQAGLLGAGGWQGVSSSNLFAVLLTGLLTLAVARLGYRLMAGAVLPTDIAMLLLHIGIVIALATSWQAYDRLIYKVAMNGPSEIAGALFPAAGIDASGLSARMQNAYDTLTTAPDPLSQVSANPAAGNGVQTVGVPPAESAPAPESLAMADRKAAAQVMVVSGAGTWMAARLALAVLLALGPFAFAASLFPVSVGFFIGWFRAVTGAALASLVIPLAIAIELQMLEGPVRAAIRAGETEITGLSAIVWSFAIVIAGLVFSVQRLAGGLSLPLPEFRQSIDVQPEQQIAATSFNLSNSTSTDSQTQQIALLAAPAAPSRTSGIVRAVEARARSVGGTAVTIKATPLAMQAGGASSARTIKRGSQIVDGARRTSADRGRGISQRPEAQL